MFWFVILALGLILPGSLKAVVGAALFGFLLSGERS